MPRASVGRTAAPAIGRKAAGEESPGSIDIRCRITSGGGDPRDSATENEPPAFALRGFGAVRVKRCGKSAPRVRQRKRHGKPHREQDRIGTATRAVRASDNTAGRCQARRPGRLLEAMCKHCPRGMAVTYRLRKRGGALQNPAYRPADVFTKRFRAKWNSGSRQETRMRGSAQHAGPLAISGMLQRQRDAVRVPFHDMPRSRNPRRADGTSQLARVNVGRGPPALLPCRTGKSG